MLTKLLSKYFVPIIFGTIALLVAIGDPTKNISAKLPIVVGEYQFTVAGGLGLLALALAYVIRRGKKQ